MADIKRIEILLDRYWRGETSRQEEAVLSAYFTSNEVADHLKYIRPFFMTLQQNKDKQLDKHFERHLLELINKDSATASGLRFFSNNLVKLAAIAILLLGITYIFRTQLVYRDSHVEKVQLGTFNDPEEAYEQVRKSLLLVSTKLNKGKDYVTELSKFNKGATLFMKQKKAKTENK